MKFYYKIINVIFVFYFICITNLYSTDIKSNTTLTDVATYIFKNLKEYSYPFYDVGKKYYGIDSSGNITVDPKQVNGKPYQPQQIINPDSIGTLCRDYHKREYIARSLRTEERWVDTSSAGTGFSQKLILKSDDMIFIMGDIHGSVHSLLRSILQLAAWGWLDNNFKIIQPNFKMIFLGDFVDRGRYSLEVVYMLLRLKVANFNNVFLLKGNHEEKNINEFYGLKTECNDKNTEKQYGTINDVFFGNLPLAIYVGCPKWNNKYLQFCHAGIHLENFSVNKSIDDLNKAGAKPCSIENPSIFTPKEMLKNVSQYCYQAIPKSKITYTSGIKDGESCGFNWTDFVEENINDIQINPDRGPDVLKFGRKKALDILKDNNIQGMIRGHQHSESFSVRNENGLFKPENELLSHKLSEIGTPFICTFSSAAEGVALGMDCFSLLILNNKVDESRLQIYRRALHLDKEGYVKIGLNESSMMITNEYSNTKTDHSIDPKLIDFIKTKTIPSPKYDDIPQKTLSELTIEIFKKSKEYLKTKDNTPQQIIQYNELKSVMNSFNVQQKTTLLKDNNEWTDKNPQGNFVQKINVDPKTKIFVMGDLHGSVHSLLRSLWRLVCLGYLDDNFKITKSNFKMIFLGDFADRGNYGIEVVYLLLRLKLANFNDVFLLQGNHENLIQNLKYGFIDEFIDKKYQDGESLYYDLMSKVFDILPLAVYIGHNDQYIQFCHGGIQFNKLELSNVKNPAIFDVTKYEFFKPKFLDSTEFIYETVEATKLNIKNFAKDKDPSFNINLGEMPASEFGFNWTDFGANDNKELFVSSDRGLGLIRVSFEAMRLFFENNKKIKVIFRGHQHDNTFVIQCSNGKANLFDSEDINEQFKFNKQYEFYTNKLNLLNGFVCTFSSAAEGVGLTWDCFGILSVEKEFKDWSLDVYKKKLSQINNYPGFVKISKNKTEKTFANDLIKIEYQKNTPFETPLDPELTTLAKPSVPTDKSKLLHTNLQQLNKSLTNLKDKLNQIIHRLEYLNIKLSNG